MRNPFVVSIQNSKMPTSNLNPFIVLKCFSSGAKRKKKTNFFFVKIFLISKFGCLDVTHFLLSIQNEDFVMQMSLELFLIKLNSEQWPADESSHTLRFEVYSWKLKCRSCFIFCILMFDNNVQFRAVIHFFEVSKKNTDGK